MPPRTAWHSEITRSFFQLSSNLHKGCATSCERQEIIMAEMALPGSIEPAKQHGPKAHSTTPLSRRDFAVRHSKSRRAMSALCQKQTYAVQQFAIYWSKY